MSQIKFHSIEAAVKAKNRKGSNLCQWFLLCATPAIDTTPHPILGDVPVCHDCKKFAES